MSAGLAERFANAALVISGGIIYGATRGASLVRSRHPGPRASRGALPLDQGPTTRSRCAARSRRRASAATSSGRPSWHAAAGPAGCLRSASPSTALASRGRCWRRRSVSAPASTSTASRDRARALGGAELGRRAHCPLPAFGPGYLELQQRSDFFAVAPSYATAQESSPGSQQELIAAVREALAAPELDVPRSSCPHLVLHRRRCRDLRASPVSAVRLLPSWSPHGWLQPREI